MLQENSLCSNGFHTRYFSLFCFQIVKLERQFSVLAELSSVVLELLFCSLALSNSYFWNKKYSKLNTVINHTFTYWALDSCISRMVTKVFPPSVMWALSNISLVSTAFYLTKPYFPSTSAILSANVCLKSFRKPQHTTHNVSVVDIPWIITHCSPDSVVKHFNTTASRSSSSA